VRPRVNLLFSLSLVAMDTIMIGLAFLLAYQLRLITRFLPAVNIAPFREYWGMLAIQEATVLGAFFFYRLYHLKAGSSRVSEAYSIFAAVSVGTIMAAAFTSFVFKNELDYPRLMVGYTWATTVALVTGGRLIMGWVKRQLRRRGLGVERVIVVGGGQPARTILKQLQTAPEGGYQVLGVVTDEEGEDFAGLPVLGPIGQVGAVVDSLEPDEVIIGLPKASHEEVLAIITSCEKGGISIKFFPDMLQRVAPDASLASLNGLPLFTVRDIALRGWKLTLKRAVDLIVSAIALVVLSPLLLLTAVLIKLDSPGPVFYIQERMGLDAEPFPTIKFRSMVADAEKDGPGWTTADDARRTRVGRLLRRFSLDETPQLINVLLGEMSLVGPRPERPVYVECFKEIVPRYMERHKEKAGLTGWAQVNGLRGDSSIAERTRYDLYYIESWSLLLDLRIMLKTLVQLLQGRHAY